MPTYAFKCRECTEEFQLARPMAESAAPASCPSGHADTVKLLTTVAIGGRASGGGGRPAGGGGGGGCCGGACGCG
jgi:putative FmdB family regulatory protein